MRMRTEIAAAWIGAALCVLIAASCSGGLAPAGEQSGGTREVPDEASGIATFAGGCFWCMEPPFEKLDGVASVVSGYTGGSEENPTYAQVSSGRTGHAEAVEIRYDPSRIDYETLLEVFWMQIDPTDAGGQFADRGRQYRTAIFVHDDAQRALAEGSRTRLAQSGRFNAPIVTEIVPAGRFYPAEEYHQDYYKKKPEHYKAYRRGSGREGFLERVWGRAATSATGKAAPATKVVYTRPSPEALKQRLTPLQYHVTQEDGTEPPFDNEYWDNQRQGIYVDVVSGEPLFSSLSKFKSGTGWPSFTRPLVSENVLEREDRSHMMLRTEIRSNHGDSHLGHVFSDGPPPTGLRYCINSAALRFIPRADLEREGYGEFAGLFEAQDEQR